MEAKLRWWLLLRITSSSFFSFLARAFALCACTWPWRRQAKAPQGGHGNSFEGPVLLSREQRNRWQGGATCRRLSLIEAAGCFWSCVELLGSGAPITRDLLFPPPFGVPGLGTSGSVEACMHTTLRQDRRKKSPDGVTRQTSDSATSTHCGRFLPCCPPSAAEPGELDCRGKQRPPSSTHTHRPGHLVWCVRLGECGLIEARQ